MGRPKIYEEPRVATAVRLPASLRDKLRSAALERDVSVNYLVTRAVAEYLRGLPPPEGQRRSHKHSRLHGSAAARTTP